MAPSAFTRMGLLAALFTPYLAAPVASPADLVERARRLCDDVATSWEVKSLKGCPICTDWYKLPAKVFKQYCKPSQNEIYRLDTGNAVWRRDDGDMDSNDNHHLGYPVMGRLLIPEDPSGPSDGNKMPPTTAPPMKKPIELYPHPVKPKPHLLPVDHHLTARFASDARTLDSTLVDDNVSVEFPEPHGGVGVQSESFSNIPSKDKQFHRLVSTRGEYSSPVPPADQIQEPESNFDSIDAITSTSTSAPWSDLHGPQPSMIDSNAKSARAARQKERETPSRPEQDLGKIQIDPDIKLPLGDGGNFLPATHERADDIWRRNNRPSPEMSQPITPQNSDRIVPDQHVPSQISNNGPKSEADTLFELSASASPRWNEIVEVLHPASVVYRRDAHYEQPGWGDAEGKWNDFRKQRQGGDEDFHRFSSDGNFAEPLGGNSGGPRVMPQAVSSIAPKVAFSSLSSRVSSRIPPAATYNVLSAILPSATSGTVPAAIPHGTVSSSLSVLPADAITHVPAPEIYRRGAYTEEPVVAPEEAYSSGSPVPTNINNCREAFALGCVAKCSRSGSSSCNFAPAEAHWLAADAHRRSSTTLQQEEQFADERKASNKFHSRRLSRDESDVLRTATSALTHPSPAIQRRSQYSTPAGPRFADLPSHDPCHTSFMPDEAVYARSNTDKRLSCSGALRREANISSQNEVDDEDDHQMPDIDLVQHLEHGPIIDIVRRHERRVDEDGKADKPLRFENGRTLKERSAKRTDNNFNGGTDHDNKGEKDDSSKPKPRPIENTTNPKSKVAPQGDACDVDTFLECIRAIKEAGDEKVKCKICSVSSSPSDLSAHSSYEIYEVYRRDARPNGRTLSTAPYFRRSKHGNDGEAKEHESDKAKSGLKAEIYGTADKALPFGQTPEFLKVLSSNGVEDVHKRDLEERQFDEATFEDGVEPQGRNDFENPIDSRADEYDDIFKREPTGKSEGGSISIGLSGFTSYAHSSNGVNNVYKREQEEAQPGTVELTKSSTSLNGTLLSNSTLNSTTPLTNSTSPSEEVNEPTKVRIQVTALPYAHFAHEPAPDVYEDPDAAKLAPSGPVEGMFGHEWGQGHFKRDWRPLSHPTVFESAPLVASKLPAGARLGALLNHSSDLRPSDAVERRAVDSVPQQVDDDDLFDSKKAKGNIVQDKKDHRPGVLMSDRIVDDYDARPTKREEIRGDGQTGRYFVHTSAPDVTHDIMWKNGRPLRRGVRHE